MSTSKKIVLALFMVTCFLIVISRFKKGECNYVVVLNDNTKIRATRVNMYKSGFADVRKCSGTSVTLKDYAIDTVYIVNK